MSSLLMQWKQKLATNVDKTAKIVFRESIYAYVGVWRLNGADVVLHGLVPCHLKIFIDVLSCTDVFTSK